MTHSKTYKNYDEEIERMQIFQRNVERIENHNERYHKGLETFEMGINQFTDITNEEFTSIYFSEMPP